MEGPSLKVSDLACRRGDRVLFRGLSFELKPGEALQVVGANGTGKSSLLRILGGLLPPFAGTVERDGSAGLMDGRLALDEHLPLAKAFMFWNRVDWLQSPHAFRNAGLDHLTDVPVRYLSTGQRKRAAILLMVIANFPVWLLDEPLNGLDADGVAMLSDYVEAFRAEGSIMVIASHQPLTLPDLKRIDLADYAA